MEINRLTREQRLKEIMARYQEPSSLEEARVRLQSAWQEKNEIEIQLSDPERNAETTEIADEEWAKWRRQAVFNLKVKEAVIRFLKSWISKELFKSKPKKEEKRKAHEARIRANAALANVDLDDPFSLIKAAHTLFQCLTKEQRVFYTDEEWALVSSLEDCLRIHTS